ncbi:MAG: cyclic nucleotide-binding domain-containing protein, partial [Thermoanaerobaculia bacterium]
FWKSLSDKLRSSNELLKTFFTEEMKMEEKLYKREEKRRSQKIKIDEDKKMDLFHEKGLSPAEIRLLATFSQEENYESDSIIFKEGEVGDKLFIILDGQVRISKFIPGIGEEALAILGRGEFFGEMALIDGSPRSADARAHGKGATILSIDKKTLGEILKMDPAASLQFLSLLTRMLTQRLKEINEKIIQWRYIVGVGGQ